MDEQKYDDAMNSCLAMIRTNCKADDALKFSQAALNLANARETWVNTRKTK